MSSETTSAAPPLPSTSTPAAPTSKSTVLRDPLPEGPSKLAVCAKPVQLTAVRLAAPAVVTLADGRQIPSQAGDWLITRGRTVLDVAGPTTLLDRYSLVAAGDLHLPLSTCERIEATTGIGTTRSPQELVLAIERLARIEIGTVKIDFTPGQLDEIATRARKRGQTVQQALQAVIDRIKEDLFWRG